MADDDREVTTFKEVYDYFLSGITDDMFMEMTKEDTEQMLEEILRAALPHIEFPKWKKPLDLDYENKCFYDKLTNDEMLLLRYYMIYEWLSFQIANVDLVRQKYSSSDFSMTSQASHLRQLIALRDNYKQEGFHLQRLMNRRYRDKNGEIHSSFGLIMTPVDRSGEYAR